VPEELELDDDDKRAFHFLAFAAGKAVGTARVVIRHGNAKIGRMAVLRSYRGRGIGTSLLKRAIAMAKQQNAKTVYLHAQVSVIGFYQALNFRCVGPVFNEAGIRHRKMVLTRRLTGREKKRDVKGHWSSLDRFWARHETSQSCVLLESTTYQLI
jgi:predicted GNAT family N-acyltransferase